MPFVQKFSQKAPPPPGSWDWEWSPDGNTWTPLPDPGVTDDGDNYIATFSEMKPGFIRAKALNPDGESPWSAVPEPVVSLGILLAIAIFLIVMFSHSDSPPGRA